MRAARLFDSVSQELRPLPVERVLSWYSCGPTVYDRTHLGHARNYVQTDIVQRFLERFGYRVEHAMGITDVDDKILRRSQELGIAATELTRKYEAEFMDCMRALRVRPPVMLGRVTEHIEDIVVYIERILDQGFAYVTPTGVYFDTQQLGDRYLLLGGHASEGSLTAQSDGSSDKRNGADFALWKFRSANGEAEAVAWDSPWGRGRPGWHIECSAIIEAAFGSGPLDVHSGGVDLCFPHHNNEIAQTCARHGGLSNVNQLFGVFFHVGHLHIEGRKMSKSLKNFITVDEFLESGSSADVFRMFCLLHHYRTNTNFSPSKLEDAKNVLEKLCNFVDEFDLSGSKAVGWALSSPASPLRWDNDEKKLMARIWEVETQMQSLILNDMRTQEVIHLLIQLTSNVRKLVASTRRNLITQRAVVLVSDFLASSGITSHQSHATAERDCDAVAQAAVDIRQLIKRLGSVVPPEYRKQCFEMSDRARDEILKGAGIEVKDVSREKSSWKWH